MPVTFPDVKTPVLRPWANTPLIPFAKTAAANNESCVLVALIAVPVFVTQFTGARGAIWTASPPSKATTPPPDRTKSVPPPTSPMRDPNSDSVDGPLGWPKSPAKVSAPVPTSIVRPQPTPTP